MARRWVIIGGCVAVAAVAAIALGVGRSSGAPDAPISWSLREIAGQGAWREENRVIWPGVGPGPVSEPSRIRAGIAAVEAHCAGGSAAADDGVDCGHFLQLERERLVAVELAERNAAVRAVHEAGEVAEPVVGH